MSDAFKELKIKIIKSVAQAGEGHLPSALSILDILWVLYDKVLKIDPKSPNNPERDRFVLSKGHAAIGLYAVLAEKGFFDPVVLQSFGQAGSFLGGHPDHNKVPGIEASTGSLGHGLPLAVGMAWALKILNNPARVYALIGDGEANEGTIWESALISSQHNLNNLVCIVDNNSSTKRALDMGDFAGKFKSFGWNVLTIDGHDHAQILEALSTTSDLPLAIIAQTVKGYGVAMMENNPEWHHRTPNNEELEQILATLK